METEKNDNLQQDVKAEKKKTIDKQRHQYMLTLNNPLDYGYTHEKIHEIIRHKFKHVIFYCMADDIAPTTGTPHTHLYILMSSKKRFSAVHRAFEHGNIEPEVKGSPAQVVAYIKKEAASLSEEKKNSLVKDSYEEWGSIPAVMPTDNKNEILLQIQEYIDQGYRPEEIMHLSVLYRQHETIIRKSFFAKRYAETPPLRDVKCVWHCGMSGSGKSYEYVRLCEKYGADDVFMASDYSGSKCNSLFDGYQAEKVVFMDELKVGAMPYHLLLQLLQGYRVQLHCRYSNAYALYTEYHISSIYTPDEIYRGMVDLENRDIDSLYQLMRRINTIVYHYKDADGNYCTYEIPAAEFTNYDDLKRRAEAAHNNGFTPLDAASPFEESQQEASQKKQPFDN